MKGKNDIMRKKITCFLLVLVMLFSFAFPTRAQAATNTELNIYAIYLNSEKKGDCTLLESKGHYLLIDLGTYNHSPAIIRQLQALGASHVDVMFSHFHIDHTGGKASDPQWGLKQLAGAGITIDTLYLEDPSLCPLSPSYPSKYASFQNFMDNQGTGKIVYLNLNDQISFGDVTGKVIGPVDTDKISPYKYTTLQTQQDRIVRYENNCSLAVIFTCGNIRYFTAGDSYQDAADALVARYGSSLKSDIMKMNHHGIGIGNTVSLIQAVQPSYAFIPNTGVADYDEKNNKWRAATALKRVTEYAFCYLVGNEQENLIIHVSNNKISLYRGMLATPENKMTGWQTLYGSDGLNRQYDMYYFKEDGTPLTGVQKIGGHYFYLGAGGKMEYGTYNSAGNYSGWRNYNGKKRYFTLSSDGKYAYMAYGLTRIGSHMYYFDKNGCMVVPDGNGGDEILQTKVGSSYYYVHEDGTLTINDWMDIGDETYFFGKNGKMYTNGVYTISGHKYLFESDGALVVASSGTEFYDFKKNSYAVRTDGTLVTGKIAIIDGLKYYFNSKGALVSNKKIRVQGKTYKSNKDGVLKRIK